MADGDESNTDPAGSADGGAGRLSLTSDSVLGDLRNVLARYPNVRLSDARNLHRAVAEWLREVDVDDVDAEVVLRSELTAILSAPLTGQGELLAAGWLLRMRPAHDLQQAETDLGGGAVGVATMSTREVDAGLKKKTVSQFRHVAARCLERWSETWAAKTVAHPRTAFQPDGDKHTVRTKAVASAVAAALDQRLQDLTSDASALRQRRMVWNGPTPPHAPESEQRKWTGKSARFTWGTVRRRMTTVLGSGLIVASAALLFVAGSAGNEPPLTNTEVLVYRPSLPAELPEATGSRYTNPTCMESATSPRRDARLCVTVNMGPMWDPCFEINDQYVSCPKPTFGQDGTNSYGIEERVLPVLQNVERQGYPVDQQMSVDSAVSQSRPWAIALQDPLPDGSRFCLAKYDDILSPLPVRFACVKWETRYALDIEATIDGRDSGATLNFASDSTVVFDLDRSQAVWKVRASTQSEGMYSQVDIAAAYF